MISSPCSIRMIKTSSRRPVGCQIGRFLFVRKRRVWLLLATPQRSRKKAPGRKVPMRPSLFESAAVYFRKDIEPPVKSCREDRFGRPEASSRRLLTLEDTRLWRMSKECHRMNVYWPFQVRRRCNRTENGCISEKLAPSVAAEERNQWGPAASCRFDWRHLVLATFPFGRQWRPFAAVFVRGVVDVCELGARAARTLRGLTAPSRRLTIYRTRPKMVAPMSRLSAEISAGAASVSISVQCHRKKMNKSDVTFRMESQFLWRENEIVRRKSATMESHLMHFHCAGIWLN